MCLPVLSLCSAQLHMLALAMHAGKCKHAVVMAHPTNAHVVSLQALPSHLQSPCNSGIALETQLPPVKPLHQVPTGQLGTIVPQAGNHLCLLLPLWR